MLYGGIMAIRGEISLGSLVTVNGYLWMLNMPLRMAGWFVNDVQRFVTSVEKIHTTFSEEPHISKPDNAITKKHYKGSIEFRNVSYQAEGEDIIQDVSFTVKPGQTIGILGPTGAGKSTIMNLLCRFYDTTAGDVLVDGVNVKDLDLYELRDNIGMAMQDVFLFSDTIEGNIAYARPDCPFEKVKKRPSPQMPTILSRLCPTVMTPLSGNGVSDSPAARSSVFPWPVPCLRIRPSSFWMTPPPLWIWKRKPTYRNS